MSFFLTKKTNGLTLGIAVLDDIFGRFKLGDFVALYGHDVLAMSFSLVVRCQLPVKQGGLASPAVFIDGGNSFNPYLLAKIARECNLDHATILEKIYVSRAFTAYQLSSLILEKLDGFLKSKKAKLLIISDIANLYTNVSKDEGENIFNKICIKLYEIAACKKTIVIVNYPRYGRNENLFYTLSKRATVLVGLRKKGRILSFALEKHPEIKPFIINFPTDYTSLTSFMGV
jgi:hypothetical protein